MSDACCPVRWLRIAADHPALAGHFPGDPVVPGTVLLDLLVALLEDAYPGTILSGIPVAKFLQPVRPDELLLLGLSPEGSGELRFVCRTGAGVVARGVFRTGAS